MTDDLFDPGVPVDKFGEARNQLLKELEVAKAAKDGKEVARLEAAIEKLPRPSITAMKITRDPGGV